jgi:hypothetical protein
MEKTVTSDFGIRCDHARREYIANQAGEIIAWSCNQCPAHGEITSAPTAPTAPRSALPTTVPRLAQCEWCGADLDESRQGRTAMRRWILKRYCDRQCYSDDLEDRRETGRPIIFRDPLLRGFSLSTEL